MVYVRHTVYLTKAQLEKMRAAGSKKQSITLTIDPTIRGNYHLYLTETQINKLKKNKPARITISKTQMSKNGGFVLSIPAIIGAIATAASVAGGVGGAANAINTKLHQNRTEAEEKRHHKAMEAKKGTGAFLPKRGRGAFLPKKSR